eukprot:c14711_g1_i2.p1 GENE.c14711_g1_i2~~c14711_g1_i2.p1  ORF type:complete len:1176 (+),score=297.74 c14711_g1_i2:420-3530(+)
MNEEEHGDPQTLEIGKIARKRFDAFNPKTPGRAITFGSINMDMIAEVQDLESSMDIFNSTSVGNFRNSSGGKGANQALALSRLGIYSLIIGRVGNDDFGQAMLESLRASQVNVNYVLLDALQKTGVAMIVKHTPQGLQTSTTKATISCAGANNNVGDGELQGLAQQMRRGVTHVMLQLEIRIETNIRAAEIAKRQGAKVCLKAAPLRKPEDLPPALLKNVDFLFCNEVEAPNCVKAVTGIKVVRTLTTAYELAMQILNENPNLELVCVSIYFVSICVTADRKFHIIPFCRVSSVDVIGAADCLVSGFMAAHMYGLPLVQALVWGHFAASLTTLAEGAQESVPTLDNLMRFMTAHAPDLHKWQHEEWSKVPQLIDAIIHRNTPLVHQVISQDLYGDRGPRTQVSYSNNLRHGCDEQQQTVLHLAVLVGSPSVLGVVLEHGSDPLATDGFQKNALQRALSCYHLVYDAPAQDEYALIVLMVAAYCVMMSLTDEAFVPLFVYNSKNFCNRLNPFNEPEEALLQDPSSREAELPPKGSWVNFFNAMLGSDFSPNQRWGSPEVVVRMIVHCLAFTSQLVPANDANALPKLAAHCLRSIVTDSHHSSQFISVSNDLKCPAGRESLPYNLITAAAYVGNVELVRLLSHKGHKTNTDISPIRYACAMGHLEMCRVLVREFGENLFSVDHVGIPAIEYYPASRRHEVAEISQVFDVFISYSHKDMAFAKRLVQELSKEVTIWIDEKIDPGAVWKDEISHALSNCRVCLVIFTPTWAASNWCQGEYKFIQSVQKEMFFVVPPPEPGDDAKPLRLRQIDEEVYEQYKSRQFCDLREATGEPDEVRLDRLKRQIRKASVEAVSKRVLKNVTLAAHDPAEPESHNWTPESAAYTYVCCAGRSTVSVARSIMKSLDCCVLGQPKCNFVRLRALVQAEACQAVVILLGGADDNEQFLATQMENAVHKPLALVPVVANSSLVSSGMTFGVMSHDNIAGAPQTVSYVEWADGGIPEDLESMAGESFIQQLRRTLEDAKDEHYRNRNSITDDKL